MSSLTSVYVFTEMLELGSNYFDRYKITNAMKYLYHFFYLAILLCLFISSCNPDCTTYSVISATIEPEFRFPGDEIMVKTNPPDFLKERELYVEKSATGGSTFEQLESIYYPEAGGRVAMLDSEIVEEGNQQIYVMDNDCGGLIALNSVHVVDESFTAINPSLFITPSPPIIIIPPVSIPSPTNLVNTWFSPDDQAYCIWFDPEVQILQDVNGQDSCKYELTILKPGNVETGEGTLELRCGATPEDLDHNNPITGFIDKTTGLVNFTIDRTGKGLGTEQFIGQLVEPSELPEEYQMGGRCNPNLDSRPTTIMVVVSQNTGRTMVLYREIPDGADIGYCED